MKAGLWAFLQTNISLQRRDFHFLGNHLACFLWHHLSQRGLSPQKHFFISLLLSQTGVHARTQSLCWDIKKPFGQTQQTATAHGTPPAAQRSHHVQHTLPRLLPIRLAASKKAPKSELHALTIATFALFSLFWLWDFSMGVSCSCTFGRVSFLLFSDSRWSAGVAFSFAGWLYTLSFFLLFFFGSFTIGINGNGNEFTFLKNHNFLYLPFKLSFLFVPSLESVLLLRESV